MKKKVISVVTPTFYESEIIIACCSVVADVFFIYLMRLYVVVKAFPKYPVVTNSETT